MSRPKKTSLVILAVGFSALGVGLPLPSALTPRVLSVSEAYAVVGRPATPVSVSGVARRTARRN